MKYISWSFAKPDYEWRSAQRPWTKTKPGNWWSDREQYPNHLYGFFYITPVYSRASWSCLFIRFRQLSRALDPLINSNFPSLISMLLFSLWWVSLLTRVSRLTWQNMCKWKVWCRNIHVMNPKSNTHHGQCRLSHYSKRKWPPQWTESTWLQLIGMTNQTLLPNLPLHKYSFYRIFWNKKNILSFHICN